MDRRNSLRVPRKRLKVLFTIPVFVFWFLLLYINNNAPKSDMLTRQSQSYHPRNVQNALKSDIMITEKTPSKEFKGIRNLHNQRQIIIRKETSPKTKNNRLSIQRKRKVHLHNLLSNNKTKRILYENQQHYLCANWDLGALGNKLFIYASLYGIAQTTGMRLVVEENIVIRKFFKKLKAVSIPENNTMCKNAVWYTEKKPCSYDKTVYEFPKNKNIIHDSYLQSWYYFKNVYDDIREQFEFKDEIITQAQSKIQKALQLYGHDFKSVLVGIHIRMSDKLGKEAKGEGHLVATKEFYNRSMNYFRTKFKNPVFIIVMSWIRESDVKWVKRNLKGSDVVFLGSSSIEVDLCALSLCNHTIMTTGTFGWWGAWLCNGITVYCKNFAVKGSEVDGYYSADLKDYFPAGWIGM